MNLNWIPKDEFHITPEMENMRVLIYVEQAKLCRRIVPEIITGDVIDGKVQICDSHNLDESREFDDFRLSTITHYAFYNDPYEN